MKPNKYIHHLSKDLLQHYPLAQFDGEVIVVNRVEQVPEAAAYLRRQKEIGVDTESRPSFTAGVHYPTALLQMATKKRCYLIRLTHVGLPEEIAAIFANPKICKIGLAFKDDLRGLRRYRDFEPANCIDLQKIVAQYGILDLGLQKIFGICFGRRISKSQQLTNWENVELTPEQARYASTDAWATLLIYLQLKNTRPLPAEEALALKRAELEAQQRHQQEVIAARQEAATESSPTS